MNKAPFIIHVSTPSSWRGGEQQVLYLCQELSARGIQQLVVTPTRGILAEKLRGICTTVGMPKHASIDIRWARAIANAAKQGIPCVIHAHDSHAHSHAVIAASVFSCRAPIVVSRRVDIPVQSSRGSQWKYNHPNVRRILCVSDVVKHITQHAVSNLDVLATVYDGIDVDRFVREPTGKLRALLGAAPNQSLIVNIAALADHKDHLTFVQAAEEIAVALPDAVFALIGEGSERENIERVIADKGLTKKVILLGHRSDVDQLLADADVFLFTSKAEGLGSSILDAMACGVPVVTTNAGGIPEIATHNVDALIAPTQDPVALARLVLSVINDGSLREHLVTQALITANRFSKSRMAEETIKHYLAVSD